MINNTVIVFDLDDTLYKEIDYVISAFNNIDKYIAKNYNIKDTFEIMYHAQQMGTNPFDALPETISINEFLDLYRFHKPSITLDKDTATLLAHLYEQKHTLGIITDGRSISQRNKINALGLDKIIESDNIIISDEFGSEKTDIRNFRFFMDKYTTATHFIYIGDNPKKDFIAPNSLGWTTICLKDNGKNIHSQLVNVDNHYKPQYVIDMISQLLSYI